MSFALDSNVFNNFCGIFFLFYKSLRLNGFPKSGLFKEATGAVDEEKRLVLVSV
jgi:hypothetical protein